MNGIQSVTKVGTSSDDIDVLRTPRQVNTTVFEEISDKRQTQQQQQCRRRTVNLRCRICLDTDRNEHLIQPCFCKGTMGLIHKSCLEEWLNVAQLGCCEICSFAFQLARVPPRFVEWLWKPDDLTTGGIGNGRELNETGGVWRSHLPGETGSIHTTTNYLSSQQVQHRHLCADLICLVIMFPLIGICGWLTIHSLQAYGFRQFHWEVFALALLFLLLMMIFAVWLVLALNYHYHAWLDWRNRHCRLRVVGLRNQPESTPLNTVREQTIVNSAETSIRHPTIELIGSRTSTSPIQDLGGSWYTPDQCQKFATSGTIPAVQSEPTAPCIEDVSSKVEDLLDGDNFNHTCLSPMPRRARLVRSSISIQEREDILRDVYSEKEAARYQATSLSSGITTSPSQLRQSLRSRPTSQLSYAAVLTEVEEPSGRTSFINPVTTA